MTKERGITFNAEMVNAILDGRKTQTRLIFNKPFKAPFSVGDKLWVQEEWQTHCDKDHIKPSDLLDTLYINYPARYDGWVSKKRQARHMPHWASRITLEITDISVQSLQDISHGDAAEEGMTKYIRSNLGWASHESEEVFNFTHAKSTFRLFWESIYGAGSWEANPWVWKLTFKVLKVKK